jgi:ATP-dependent helicase/nuclease subunit A
VSSTSSGRLVVRAGAGAGKTTALVEQVLNFAIDFHAKNNEWPKLAVTTFTRKATQELRERLLHKALSTKNPGLIQFVQKPSQLHISTIHGVLSLFLRKYGSQMGLSPRFSMVDGAHEAKLFRRIIKKTLTSERAMILEDLSLQQVQSALQKYFVLRMQAQIPLKIWNIEEIHAVFAELDKKWVQRAQELLQYLDREESSELWQSYKSLLSSCCQSLATDPKGRLQYYAQFKSLRPSPRFKKGTDKSYSAFRKSVQDDADMWIVDYMASEEGISRAFEINSLFLAWAEEVFTLVKDTKMTSGLLTMSDLEVFALELIRESEPARDSFSSEWNYWLIDEYQDTSPIQVQILETLIDRKPYYVVGDPQQSIYLFRGARSEVFVQKEKLNLSLGGENIKKRTNYRSRPEVLHFLNFFFKNLSPHFEPMDIGRAELADPLRPSAFFISCAEEKAEEEIENPESESDLDEMELELEAAAGRCLELVSQGLSPEKICVLSRTNKTLQKLSVVASRRGLPVQVHASAQFYSRSEVKDALYLLKFLVNPHDNLNFLSLLRSPWYHCPDKTLIQFTADSPLSYWYQFRKVTPALKAIEALQQLLEQTQTQGIGVTWRQALWDCGLILSARQRDSSGRREANLWKVLATVQTLERKAGFNYAEFCISNLTSDLETDSADGDSDATPVIVPQRVNLMTVHAAKGLQFEHVILLGAGIWKPSPNKDPFVFDENRNRLWLSIRNPEKGSVQAPAWSKLWHQELEQRSLAEYDRVLYVALTRAQSSLDFFWSRVDKNSWASRMWKPGEANPAEKLEFVAQFLDSKALAEFKSLTPQKTQIVSKEFFPLKLELSQTRNISVSELAKPSPEISAEAARKDSAPDQPLRLKRALDKAVQGVAVHRLFESLKYQDFSEAQSAAKNSDIEMKALGFMKSWQDGLMLKWIESGYVEWGFTLPIGAFFLQGQIDLWTLNTNASAQDELIVVDYKTGSESFVQDALQQLEVYAWALQKMKKFVTSDPTKVKLVAFYPLTGKVHIQHASPFTSELVTAKENRFE